MNDTLLSEYISSQPNAKTIVLFGGNPRKRHEVIKLLSTLQNLTIYGTLSEEEGIEKLKSLPKVDIVLIGGRYDDEQRKRIVAFVKQHLPATKVTQPGYDYPYSDEATLKAVEEIITMN